MKRIFIILVFLTLILIQVSAEGTPEEREIGDPDSDIKILIAMESTSFKDALVEEIIEGLNDGATYIKVIDHKSSLGGVDPRDFTVVFITNSGAKAEVRPWVLEWLESVKNYDDNIILHTTQINDWNPPVEVDSITSASDKDNVGTIAQDIILRIKNLY